jgi:hypothetical protein
VTDTFYRVEGRDDYALHADRECPSIQGRSVRAVDRTSYPDADLCERCSDRESESDADTGRTELAIRLKNADSVDELRGPKREVA